MAIKNRECLSCGTQFKHCPDCSRVDALKPAWASQFCSETCKDLWMTLTKFGMNRLTKSEAQSIISSLNLKPIDSYVSCIQRDYAKVMEPEKKPKRGKRIEIKPIDDFADIEVVEPVETDAPEVVTIENK